VRAAPEVPRETFPPGRHTLDRCPYLLEEETSR
jgi:hypothetical protein